MEFKSLISLINKNLRMFFRSKFSAATVILIPFLIVMLAGFAFNSEGLSNVQVGLYSEGYTDFTTGVITDFENNGFSSNKYDTHEQCIESVKHSDSQICVIFPKDLTSKATTEEIIFYVDYSRVNIANNLINEIEKSILVKTTDVGEGMAQGLIDSLESIKTTLPNSKITIDNILKDAIKNRDESKNLEFPTENISNAIDELDSIKGDVNENDTSVIEDIEDLIEDMEDIESMSKLTEDSLGDTTEGQNELITKLTTASSDMNSLIVTLNSYQAATAGDIVSPIKTKIEAISSDADSSDYVVPIILSLIALFGSILLSSTFIIKEKKTKAFFRNFMAPTRNITFILSTYLTCLAILLIQFSLIFVGAKYMLKIDIMSMIGPLFITLLITLLAFVSIGMFIGYLFRSDETVIFASMIFSALLMFFSNIILPLENISPELVRFFRFNPLVIANLAFKKMILFGFGFGAIWNELLILFGFFVVFFILNCVFRSLTKRIL
ncbi:ABC transporter permease [Candidatus Pacearchaeota archaeon]|nr:ABC transporter permease [Candidatus Pacearchaeota archaeon]